MTLTEGLKRKMSATKISFQGVLGRKPPACTLFAERPFIIISFSFFVFPYAFVGARHEVSPSPLVFHGRAALAFRGNG